MDPRKLITADVERLLLVPRTTIDYWKKNGCPHVIEDNRAYFDLATILKWYGEYKSGKTTGKQGADTRAAQRAAAPEAELKRRKLAAEAEIAEIEVARQRGELVEAAVFEAAYRDECAMLSTRLNNMPAILAPLLVSRANPVEIQELLEREIFYALTALSTDEGIPRSLSNDTTEST